MIYYVLQTTKKKNQRAARGRVSHNKSPGLGGIPNPPQWTSTIKVNYVQRFVVNAPIQGVQISNVEILDLKCVAAGATSAYRLFSGVKLNSVDMWCANSSATASNTILVEWYSNNPNYGSDSKMCSDTAVGTTNVAHVHAVPPRNSYSASWLPNQTTQYALFYLTCPQGTIIDVNLTATFLEEDGAVAVHTAPVGATTGVVYTRFLDSIAGTPEIAPIGVNTI